MNPALFFGLWCFAFGSLLSGSWFIHTKYTEVIHREAQQFEQDWLQLEHKHAKI